MVGKKISLVLDLCINLKFFFLFTVSVGLPFTLLFEHHRDFIEQVHRLGRVRDPRRGTR